MLRITTITDSLGQATTLTYGLTGDAWKITQVMDPFGRSAIFTYTSGQLTKITDPVGIESEFGYESGSDFINLMTTPYGYTTFAKGENGNTVRWLEATVHATNLGISKERVEYNDSAPNTPATEASAPAGVDNNNLQFQNTFYWDKKAMADAPGDYSKAQVFHWLSTADGKVSGIKHSEKKALENRVWYTYPDQNNPSMVGSIALPAKRARLLGGGATELSQYKYNTLGNVLTETDPVGRVKSYVYDANNIDVNTVYQRNPSGVSVDPDGQPADKIASNTYNGLHEPLITKDAAGQTTTYSYRPDGHGQLQSVQNAKGETTTYSYGPATNVPADYLASITSPAFNGSSATTTFTYDTPRRVRTVTNSPDNYTVTADYDNLDRKTQVTYPDNTYEQFQYTQDFGQGPKVILDLTGTRDRLGRWTYRHYNGNRQMDSITDPLNRTTLYGWCTCGTLTSITDPENHLTTFNRDLQSRVYQKAFADSTTINYLFDGQTAPNTVGATSRLKSATDALGRRANYSYVEDGNLSEVSYTNAAGGSLVPPTSTVNYIYDSNYNRIERVLRDLAVETMYEYYLIAAQPVLGAGQLRSIDGPLGNDTIVFTYDELGRPLSQSIDGVAQTVAYDSLGRLTTTDNALGHFSRVYDGVTPRLQTLTYPSGQTANYSYFGNNDDRRLQTLENVGDEVYFSKFDYAYDDEGQIMNWSSLLGTTTSGRWFDYDNGRQLLAARNASNPSSATQRFAYGYDRAGNRTSDGLTNGSGLTTGTYHSYTLNAINQVTTITLLQTEGDRPLTLSYDLAGNMTSNGNSMTYEWDAANRLVAINYTGTSNRSEFTYDGLNRRVKIVEKTGSTVTSTKQFVWVGNSIAQERSASNAITRRYFAEGEKRTKAYFYSRDHLGSIREMTSGEGVVQARYDYDPYGQRTKLSGTLDVDFGYTGHYHHAPSGLNLTLYRAYNPALGRWISRDPIGEQGGLNLYGYVGNKPINRIDPLGEQGAIVVEGIVITIEEILTGGAVTNFILHAISESCGKKKCPPCFPYPKETIGYIGPHDGSHGAFGPGHVNLFKVNQDPDSCKCYWNRASPDAAERAQLGWVDLNGGFPVLSP
ncbi:MAG TPA: RHS repeat-associated core domain-containing protein, partial [Chthoniobacterales bacterium]|nr:RHS repeat-associated core domain-containing protein [Chthoniobacterales bacterium]